EGVARLGDALRQWQELLRLKQEKQKELQAVFAHGAGLPQVRGYFATLDALSRDLSAHWTGTAAALKELYKRFPTQNLAANSAQRLVKEVEKEAAQITGGIAGLRDRVNPEI